MSALCQKATSRRVHSITWSASEQRRWHGEAQRFGGFQIGDELELGRLLHSQICGFGTLQNLINIFSCAPIGLLPIRTA
jgi:hypothetical protein